jgi:hypothetical protein
MYKDPLVKLIHLVTMIVFCHLFSISNNVYSQSWRGLILGESSCDDIKRAVGIDECTNSSAKLVKDDETIIFTLSLGRCETAADASTRYRLPKGSLEHILVINRFPKTTTAKDFGWESFEFEFKQDGDILGSFVFTNRKEGIRYTAATRDAPFSSYSIFPGANYGHLKCSETNVR